MKLLCFQFEAKEVITDDREYIEEKSIREQLDKSFELISAYSPDIVVYPELCYIPSNYLKYKELSIDRMIIAGSYYDDNNINTTVVFQNGEVRYLPKLYPSPYEPMFVTQSEYIEPEDIVLKWKNEFLENRIPDYFIKMKNGKYLVVLNCLDYYKLGSFVARNLVLSKDLSILVCPCSNNNLRVFVEESQVIHNHNGDLYSLVVNSNATLCDNPFSAGHSYVFGMIDSYSHKYQAEKGESLSHPASIVQVGKERCAIYVETEDTYSPFKRNDKYRKNPKLIKKLEL